MLAHPDPKDWLMYRGNYQGWSYSALSQINDRNVDQLQLKWSWAMNEGGASEATAHLHDGIMFLANTSNTVQALDAQDRRTVVGEPLGPAPTPRLWRDCAASRVYEDKVYIDATDAKLYALDAKTGKMVWQTDIADARARASMQYRRRHRHPRQGHCRHDLLRPLGRCRTAIISAYDAKTGKRAWKFATVALTGEPGGDTWGNLPDDMRAGARDLDRRHL